MHYYQVYQNCVDRLGHYINRKSVTDFIKNYKVTSAITFIILTFFAFFNVYRTSFRFGFNNIIVRTHNNNIIISSNFQFDFNSNYDIVMSTLMSIFMHANLRHLIFNLIVHIQFRNVEKKEGSLRYFYKIMYFVLMYACLVGSLYRLYDIGFAVGYSGVLFGLITLYPQSNFFGYECKKSHYPFIMLIFAQFFHDNTSFTHHLVGIITAYIYISVRDMQIGTSHVNGVSVNNARRTIINGRIVRD